MIKYGHLDIDVSSVDLAQLNFVDLQQCYCQYDNLVQYYNKHNSSIWQMFDSDCPQWLWDIAENLLSNIEENLSFVVSIVRLDPGNTVPNHVDGHYIVQEKYGKGKTSRYLIMLEDWGLLKLVDSKKAEDLQVSLSQIKIIGFREKDDWQLVPKYNIGKKAKKD